MTEQCGTCKHFLDTKEKAGDRVTGLLNPNALIGICGVIDSRVFYDNPCIVPVYGMPYGYEPIPIE